MPEKAPKLPKYIDLEITQADVDNGIAARTRVKRDGGTICGTCPVAQALTRRAFTDVWVGPDLAFFTIDQTSVRTAHSRLLCDQIARFDATEKMRLGTYRMRITPS